MADFEYDSGYGSAKIAEDLIIVLADGSYLGRSEYDGAEEWVHRGFVDVKSDAVEIKVVGGSGVVWQTVDQINS